MKVFQVLVCVAVGIILCSGKALNEGKRLIKTSEQDPGKWMTEDQVFELIQNQVTFMDITDFDYSTRVKPSEVDVHAVPTTLRFNSTVQQALTNLNGNRIQEFITHFSSYHTRYYSSQPGRQSQLWLLAEVQSSVANYVGEAEVVEVDHGYLQKSIIARLVGSDSTLASEVVIVGAHLDSTNRLGGTLNAPGADDNGSGSVAILEALRLIVESGVVLKRTVEFQWYAAEEIGLRGSQAIAQQYKRENVNVAAMLNLDVVAYHDGKDSIGIYTDNGNSAVIQFLRLLTDGYLTYGRRDNTCGYGCSDHASWTANGFPAAMSSEYTPHPQMHTVRDTMANMNFAQLNEFVKLVLGFVIEISEPSS